jgi:acyl transferase domain-containing protein
VSRPSLAFVYSSRESVWPGIGAILDGADETVRRTVEACEREIRRHRGWSLREELARRPDYPSLLAAQNLLEPALTTVQIALTESWRRRGVEPDAAAGRSVGEFAAGYVTGELTLEQAIELSCRVSRLVDSGCWAGRVIFVELPVDRVEALQAAAPAPFYIATDDRPDTTYVACALEVLEAVTGFLRVRGVAHRVEPFPAAAHCPLMDAGAAEFLRPLASGDARGAPRLPRYSAVGGQPARAASPDCLPWWRAIRERVRIRRMFEAMLADGHTVFLEIGGRASLASMIQHVAAADGRHVATLASMRMGEPIEPVLRESAVALAGLGLIRPGAASAARGDP